MKKNSEQAKKDLLKALKKKSPKKMADGGDPADSASEDDSGGPTGLGGGDATPPAAPIVAPTDTSIPPPPPPGSLSPTATVTVTGYRPPTATQDAQQKMAEADAMANDFQNGKIQPKTYHDLYNDKSTLGKIGTLFGIMVSGAGSGLAHQNNAAMDLMNNEINRDLQAQQTTQTNRQNWYKLANEHERYKNENNLTAAQTLQTQAATQGTNATTLNQLNDLAYKIQQNKTAGVPEIDGMHTALTGMTLGMIQNLQDKVNTMPSGDIKTQAQNVIDQQVRPYFTSKIVQDGVAGAQKKAALSALNPGTPPQQMPKELETNVIPPAVNEKALAQGLIKGGQQMTRGGSLMSSDAIDPAERNDIDAEVKDREALINSKADWMNIVNQLYGMKNAGQVPAVGLVGRAITGVGAIAGSLAGSVGGPAGTVLGGTGGGAAGAALGSAATEALKEQFERKREILVGNFLSALPKNFTEDEKKRFESSSLPSWTDTPDTIKTVIAQGNAHFSRADNYPKMERHHIKTPLPSYKFSPVAPPPEEAPSRARAEKLQGVNNLINENAPPGYGQ